TPAERSESRWRAGTAIRVPTKIAGRSSAARMVLHRRFSWVPGAGTTSAELSAMTVTLTAIPGIPLVRPGDDLADLLIGACERARVAPIDGDILVIAQKIVSKAEGCYVDLMKVEPSPRARRLAAEVGKDARLVEIILQESRSVVRYRPGVLIVEHRLGCIMANAGVDRSNLDATIGREPVLLLPHDPDTSAARLRERIADHFGSRSAVIISDSWGRAWR